MIKKIAAAVLALGLCASLAPVCAEGENLIANPGFESVLFGGVGVENWNFTGTDAASCVIKGTEANPAHGGEYYINLPDSGSMLISKSFGIEDETNYTLSFWARSSVLNSGFIDMRYYIQGKQYDVYCKNNLIKYTNGEHLFQEYFGLQKSAPTGDEADTRFEWYPVSFSFITPPMAEAVIVNIYNKSSEGDPFLCLDDFSFTKNNEINYIKNGGFENTKGPDLISSWTKLPTGDGTYTLVDNGQGGKYLKTTGGSLQLQTAVPLHSGRWRLSFDHKPDASRSYTPTVYLKCAATAGWITGWKPAQMAYTKGAWTTYEYYFTVPEYADPAAINNGYLIDDFRIGAGWGPNNNLDNVRLVPDKSGVSFSKYKSFTTNPVPASMYTSDNAVYTDKISTAGTTDGKYDIDIIGHYVPKTAETESFTVIGALYRVYDNGKIQLQEFVTADGTASGTPVSVSGKILVTKLTGGEGYTYRLKAFITGESLLDGVQGTGASIGY